MIKTRHEPLNTRKIDFQINREGVVQVSFGPIQVCMTLDSAYELQYALATFLADLELEDYPTECEDESPGVMEGRQTLEALVSYSKLKPARD